MNTRMASPFTRKWPRVPIASVSVLVLGAWLVSPGSTAHAAAVLPDDPSLNPNLSAWFRADDVNVTGSTVDQWNDRSGNGNNATSSGAKPTYTPSSAAFNNRPVVSFAGTSSDKQHLRVSSNLYGSDRDMTVFVVANTNVSDAGSNSLTRRTWTINRSSDSNASAMAIGQEYDKLAVAWNDGTTPFVYPQTSGVIGDGSTGTAYLATLTQATASGELNVHLNGLGVYDNSSFNFTTDIGSGSHFWIGSQGSANERFWNGDIAEIVVYDRVLNSAERENVEAYLAIRYGMPDTLMDATTEVNGNQTSLTSVRTLHRGTIAAEDLVGTDVFHWHAASSGNTVLSRTDPGQGNRATLIDGDLILNTGMINPGDSDTLTPAQQATLGPDNSSINGLGVMFEGQGLHNGPGFDLIVAELANPGEEDHFRVNRIDGVEGDLIVGPGDYELWAGGIGYRLVTPNSSSLTNFETSDTWSGGTTGTQGWAMVGIDLSDLGYAPDEWAPGLLFSDGPGTGNVDLVLIAGLPDVPEPATGLLLAVGLLGLVGCRLRRRCPKR